MKLTEKTAKTIKAKGDLFMDGSVPNLMLKSNGKVGRGMWVFRYVSPTALKRRDMSLARLIHAGPERGLADVA